MPLFQGGLPIEYLFPQGVYNPKEALKRGREETKDKYLNYALKCAKLGCGLKQTETVLAVLKDEWDKVRWNRLKACKRAIDTLNEENN